MATDPKKLQPIIIKRIKKASHSAHGGAWKIAYADFVTAMMAFFLLMWLLGSTTEGDKKGLSDYFTAPLKVAMTGGSGAGASNSIINGGGSDLTKDTGQTPRSTEDKNQRKIDTANLKAEIEKQDGRKLDALSEKIKVAIKGNKKLSEYSSQIRLDRTPDGLQIQILDDQNRPMFDLGSATVKPYMQSILREIGSSLKDVENKISLDGHTDRTAYSSAERGYSNWELSSDRANASRRELVAAGMTDEKIARVVGLASSILFEPENPLSPSNRRISILVMTREAQERLMGSGKSNK